MTEEKVRRYKPSVEFYYDFKFSSECRSSEILTERYHEPLETLLESRQERLQRLTDELEDITAAQEHSKQVAFNKGSRWKEPDRDREKRVTLEARIDVCNWEIKKLEQAIEEEEEDREQREIPPCLPRGPQGHLKVSGTTGTGYADGQWCEPVNGIPVITDDRSPWRGMAVMDYTEFVVKPWKRACTKHNKRRRKELLAQGKKDDQIPRRINAPWPKGWPEGVKRHINGATKAPLKKKSKSIVRTKK